MHLTNKNTCAPTPPMGWNSYDYYDTTVDEAAVKIMIMQEVGDEIAAGLALCGQIHEYVRGFQRTELPFSKLVIGVNCGGSDGLSGITARARLCATVSRTASLS